MMEITVEEFVHIPGMEGSHIVAGQRGKGKIVTALSMLDGFVGYPYLKSNMMAISSGYFLAADQEKVPQLLNNLANRGVSGITLKDSYFNGELPEKIIQTANELDFPIINLNTSIRFCELFDFFYSHVYCYNQKKYLPREEIVSSLVGAIYDNSLDGFCRQLFTWTGKTILIALRDKYFCYPQNVNSILGAALTEYSAKECFNVSERYPGIFHFNNEGTAGLGILFSYKKGSDGLIWLEGSDASNKNNDVALLRAAKAACETGAMQISSLEQEDLQEKAHFIDGLISGNLYTLKEAVPIAQHLSWYIPHTLQALVIRDEDDAATCQQMEAVLSQMLRGEKNIIISPYRQELVMLLPGEIKDREELLKRILGSLHAQWRNHSFHLGLGQVVSFKDTHISYSQACLALNLRTYLRHDKEVISFADLGIFCLYGVDEINTEITAICQKLIGPLIEFEASSGLCLIKTLIAFFHNKSNYSKTGQQLFVHANTVRYRIDLVEKVCQISFENYHDMLNMQFALEFMPFVFPKYR